jgi:hypothetical protein
MGFIEVSPRVQYRSELGRFATACDEAAYASVRRLVDMGARLARMYAPQGETGELRSRIRAVEQGKQGYWVSEAPHSMAVERGSRGPYEIGAEGQKLHNPRDTSRKPKGFAARGPVTHPGIDPQPFMEPAYAEVRAKMIEVMREEYPGRRY